MHGGQCARKAHVREPSDHAALHQATLDRVPHELNEQHLGQPVQHRGVATAPRTRFGLIDWRTINERSRQLMKALESDIDPTTKLKDFSIAQRHLVAIARALVHEPQLVVCDEPTSALDHETGHNVMHILHRMTREAQRTLIVVTHDARIFGFADRIARMDDGRVVNIETGVDFRSASASMNAGVPVHAASHPSTAEPR